MNALVGKAQEEDDQFYNGLFGEVDESDRDFNSQDESCSSGKDSFDSDFGRSSDEGKDAEADENESENNLNREEKREKKKVKFITQHKS